MRLKSRCRFTKDDLIDAALVLGILVITAPGVIWWALTIWALFA